jgi:hypothetical protein
MRQNRRSNREERGRRQRQALVGSRPGLGFGWLLGSQNLGSIGNGEEDWEELSCDLTGTTMSHLH